jgi:Flp pilus assembly protein TadD
MKSTIDSRSKAEAAKSGASVTSYENRKRLNLTHLVVFVFAMLLLAGAAYYSFSKHGKVESVFPLAIAGSVMQAPEEVTPVLQEKQPSAESASRMPSLTLDTEPVSDGSHAEKMPLASEASIFSIPSLDKTENKDRAEHDSQIQIRMKQPTSTKLMLAYQAYLNGDNFEAQRGYLKILEAEPHQVDALLGMAAITARQEKTEEAVAWCLIVLEKNPHNMMAQAALVNFLGRSNHHAAEARIKSLIQKNPDMPDLHAVLGAIQIQKNDWREAQRAYLEAHRLEPQNPQHAFNLAVALDHMGKTERALDYYRHAQILIRGAEKSMVDKAALELRIAQIEAM